LSVLLKAATTFVALRPTAVIAAFENGVVVFIKNLPELSKRAYSLVPSFPVNAIAEFAVECWESIFKIFAVESHCIVPLELCQSPIVIFGLAPYTPDIKTP
jgi:hypothetical protein